MVDDFKNIKLECLICGGRAFFFTKKNNFNLYRCSKCNLIFVHNLLKEVAGIYSKDYFLEANNGFGYVDYEEDKLAMRGTFIKYLELIEVLQPSKGKLLDVGAATGIFLELAKMRGWDVCGLEISNYAAKESQKKGLNVINGTLESADFNEELFDVVTLWDVLEHMPKPKISLQIIYKILKPGGILVINTPDAGSLIARLLRGYWHLIVPPEHLYYFNVKNLSLLLREIGFKIIKVKKIGKRFTINYILQTLYRWQGINLWNSLINKVRNKKFGNLGIPINLRDNFIIFSKK